MKLGENRVQQGLNSLKRDVALQVRRASRIERRWIIAGAFYLFGGEFAIYSLLWLGMGPANSVAALLVTTAVGAGILSHFLYWSGVRVGLQAAWADCQEFIRASGL